LADRIILMSGTPLSGNSFKELINQYKIYEYNDNVSSPIQTPNLKHPKPMNLIQTFQGRYHRIERVASKSRRFINVEIGCEKVKEEYIALRKMDGLNIICWEIECSKLKIKHFLNNYSHLLEGIDKALVYYKHNEIADMFFAQYNSCTLTINGKTNLLKRGYIINDFISNAKYKYLLVQIKVGNCGLNLNKINKIIFLQLDWNPITLLQAEDRIHRIGQHHDCEIFYIITQEYWLMILKE